MRLYTLTPNPAIDLSGHAPDLIPNEKNYVQRPRVDPGGNAINAGRIAHRLGGHVTMLGFAGGATGRQLSALLEREGVRARFTKIDGDTRTNVTVTNDSDHQQTRLTFPGPRISPQERARLKRELSRITSRGIFILGGSLPEGCPPNFYEAICAQLQNQKLGVIVDVPAKPLGILLSRLRGELLLIKPNDRELAELTGSKQPGSEKTQLAAAKRLTAKSALVCVSRGEHGALLVTKDRAWRGAPVRVKARGTVGAGDSMVGAMALRLATLGLLTPQQLARASDSNLADVLAWGLAAGAATASSEGTSLAKATAIRALRKKARIERINAFA